MASDSIPAERDGSVFTCYGAFDVEYRDASHRYWLHDRDGKRHSAVSVTSVLKIIDKPALLSWAEGCGAEAAVTLERDGALANVPARDAINFVRLYKMGADGKRDSGADRGTIVHNVLEAYGRDGTVPSIDAFPEEIRGYVQGLCRWLLQAKPKALAIEQSVGSLAHRFAGRVDLVAEIDGDRCLCDLKTNPAGRVYDEAHLQAAGYLIALDECNIDVTAAKLVAVGEAGNFVEEPCLADAGDFLSTLDTQRRVGRLRNNRAARQRGIDAQRTAALAEKVAA